MNYLRTGAFTVLFLFVMASATCRPAFAASVTLQWTAPADDGSDCSTGNVAGFDVRYSRNPISDSNWFSATVVPVGPDVVIAACGTTQEFTITGLAGGVKYYFAVKSFDEVGNYSGLSNVPSYTTPEIISPAAATDLRVKNP